MSTRIEAPSQFSDIASTLTISHAPPRYDVFHGERSNISRPETQSNTHSRGPSMWTLSRVSFSDQIAQLTAIRLPNPASLANSISGISTSRSTLIILDDAAYQIKTWISKASIILDGLKADDDISWASAAGREGVDQVDEAIIRFEDLIQVYVNAIEGLQQRKDSLLVPSIDLNRNLDHIEEIATLWEGIKNTLQTIKHQVELSLEWEELRNRVFAQIEAELGQLRGIVFETEERRHQHDEVVDEYPNENGALTPDSSNDSGIMSPNNRLSLISTLGNSSSHPATVSIAHEETVIGLVARMKPLRASLDFLPIRTSRFKSRAVGVFPSACQDLEAHMLSLEQQWAKLESDAEHLTKELAEDRWVLVFRNAAKQALKMIASVARSVAKVDESLESNTHFGHAPGTRKKIESYEYKKTHYSAAIDRMLAIVATGLGERRTINGEIIRLQADVSKKWSDVKARVENLDSILDEYDNVEIPATPRSDPFSPSLKTRPSFQGDLLVTPRSSPSSSLRGLSKKFSCQELGSRAGWQTSPTAMSRFTGARLSNLPRYGPHSPPSAAAPQPLQTSMPPGMRLPLTPASTSSRPPVWRTSPPKAVEKPRWNSSTKVDDVSRRPQASRAWSGVKPTAGTASGRATPLPATPASSVFGVASKMPASSTLSSPMSTSRYTDTRPPAKLAFAGRFAQLPTPDASPFSEPITQSNAAPKSSNTSPPGTGRTIRSQPSRGSMWLQYGPSSEQASNSPRPKAPLRVMTSSRHNVLSLPRDREITKGVASIDFHAGASREAQVN